MMLRVLLIVTLVGYVLYKLGLFRGLLKAATRDSGPGRHFKRPVDGNVNIDSMPEERRRGRPSQHKEGEYVDYEEIK